MITGDGVDVERGDGRVDRRRQVRRVDVLLDQRARLLDVRAERELRDDERERVGGRGLEGLEARHAGDRPLDRLGHLVGDVGRAGARERRDHGDHRQLDVRQELLLEVAPGGDARDEQRGRQQERDAPLGDGELGEAAHAGSFRMDGRVAADAWSAARARIERLSRIDRRARRRRPERGGRASGRRRCRGSGRGRPRPGRSAPTTTWRRSAGSSRRVARPWSTIRSTRPLTVDSETPRRATRSDMWRSPDRAEQVEQLRLRHGDGDLEELGRVDLGEAAHERRRSR